MSRYNQALKSLRDQGCRLTPQRLLVLSAVAEGSGHMGVDAVFQRARESYPYLDIATVYRTLHLFKRMGVVTEVGIGDRLHFELTDPAGHHHHMVCKVCGGAFDLSPHYLEGFRGTLAEQFGFEPDLDHFTVPGICAGCIGRETAGSKSSSGKRSASRATKAAAKETG